MYINGINGYLSKFKGAEVDAAVERVQGLDSEMEQKVDKTTTINDIPLTGNIVLTPEDIGSVPAQEGYGRSLNLDGGLLSLLDQKDRTLSSVYVGSGGGILLAYPNPALTTNNGIVTWTATNETGTKDLNIQVYRLSTGRTVLPNRITVNMDNIIIELLAPTDVEANTYRAVAVG